MSDLSEMIAKLEGATGPSRELDAMIVAACDLRPDWLRNDRRSLVTGHDGHVSAGKNGPGFEAPPLTSSIDAALTLGRTPSERLSLLDDAVRAVAKRRHLHIQRLPDDTNAVFEVCREVLIAALKARATMEDAND